MAEEQQQQRVIQAGLDANYNPVMTPDCKTDGAIANGTPVRDVDWRQGPQEIRTAARRRAAYGQRCGMVVLPEHRCNRCKRDRGVFASCVVNAVDGELQAEGACMNCVWTREAYRCSHRMGKRDSLAAWELAYVAGETQSAAAQPEAATLNTASVPSEVAPVSDSGAGTSAELPLGSQAWDGPPWYGPWYNSPLQRPPSQFEWGELLQISEELLTTRSRIEYDIQQLRDQIEEQHGRYDAV